MSTTLIATLALASLFTLMLLRVPVAIALMVSGVLGFGLQAGWGPAFSLLASEPAGYLSNGDLATIPLFLLMGAFAGLAGLSSDLYRLAAAFLGHWRGGLAYATIGGCAGFGAICGSSMATVATMTRVAMPEMRARGYDRGLAAGTIAAGGTLGILIPPSIVLVIYAVMTEQFVVTLFAAAVIPGLIAVSFQMLAVRLYLVWRPGHAPASERIPLSARWALLCQSWRVLALVFVVSGGIYAGIFTATEAAAVGCVLAGAFAWRAGRMDWAATRAAVLDTALTTAMIYLMVVGASVFTYFLSVSRIPLELVSWIEAQQLAPTLVILALLVFYIILGCFFETMSALVITLPFVFPLVMSLGYDPIWWGIVCVMVVELGLITPPFGLNLFVISGMCPDISTGRVATGTLPFFVADLARLGLLVAVPGMALWLPGVLGL